MDKMEHMIAERLKELNPEPPLHEITGKPCPKTGLYRVQGTGPIIERVFEKDEILPTAPSGWQLLADNPLPTTEVTAIWVYISPLSDDD